MLLFSNILLPMTVDYNKDNINIKKFCKRLLSFGAIDRFPYIYSTKYCICMGLISRKTIKRNWLKICGSAGNNTVECIPALHRQPQSQLLARKWLRTATMLENNNCLVLSAHEITIILLTQDPVTILCKFHSYTGHSEMRSRAISPERNWW